MIDKKTALELANSIENDHRIKTGLIKQTANVSKYQLNQLLAVYNFMVNNPNLTAEDVKKVVGRECRVEEDDTITLGGLKASTDTFTADDTIQCRLEAMKSWFRENSGLEIV